MTKFNSSIALLGLLIGALPFGVNAMGSKNPNTTKTPTKNAANTQAQMWYDGDRAQTAWMSQRLVAEFDAPSNSTTVKSADPNATERTHNPSAKIKIWETQTNADQVIAQLKTKNPNSKVSPVFYDSPSPGGRMRALPGNVIVYLDPSFNATRVAQWAAQNQVEIIKKLGFAPNAYLIKTDPGLAALAKANALRQAAGVVSTSPEWWQEVSTR